MVKVVPTNEIKNLYINFMYLLNGTCGRLVANDSRYYDFLDGQRVTHEQLLHSITICSNIYERMGYPFVVTRDGKVTKSKQLEFFLTKDSIDLISNYPANFFPPLQKVEIKKPPIKKEEVIKQEQKVETKKADVQWTRDEVVELLTTEAHVVGRMLGHGYDLLEEIHGNWIREWILNPSNFKVMVHQAHRSSFKSTCLRLAVAIMIVLKPLTTIIVLRKSEDAVKELVMGVSKILDTPLFQTFINILYPDINAKGGFKKTTDTALAIDTNLNVSLSGEYQLRALGLGSPLTGKHAEFIITDDIVTTTDRESAAERMSTIAKYQELMNILSNNKGFQDTRILNIGTPWHEEDAFSLMEKGLKAKSDIQKRLEDIPQKQRTNKHNEAIRQLNMQRGLFVYNCYQTGLMSDKDIEWKKQTLNDDVLFAANYMLSLVSDDEKPFPKINNVGNYKKAYFAEAWEVCAAIDCSYGGEDSTSISIGAFDWDNNNTVVYGKMYDIAIDKNYMEIAEDFWNCGVQTIYLESNADKGLMGEKFRELGFNVIGYHESMNKHAKIVGTIRPFWREKSDGILPCVQFVEETDIKYLSQIMDYKQGVRHDDAPDNLACLLLRSKFGALSIRVT